MQCPICGALAENITKAGFDGLGVRCKNCGDFEVADAAVNGLLRLEEPMRVAALDHAKRLATADIPTISTACF